MKAYVDQDTCIGCGLCTGIEPSVFRMNDVDQAEAYQDVTEAASANVQEAIASCPVSAISQQ